MSNYSKTTNFAVKDALLTGDPLKVIKGADINTEFDNIATAISSKVDTGGALGTPASGVATNLTGTAAGLTAGGVTTNANLTGPITSSGNATSIASGNTYASPTFTGTVSGTPTWASSQAITTSTAAQPNITSLGASAVWGTGVANFGTIVKRKTADESVTSSTTLQNDDHLTFAVAANEEWIGNFDLPCGPLLSTTGIKVTISAPSGAAFQTDYRGFIDGSASMNNAGNSTLGSTQVDFTTASWAAAGAGSVKISFWILNGATPGNITLQWAQSTSSGSAVTVKKGAFLHATRVA